MLDTGFSGPAISHIGSQSMCDVVMLCVTCGDVMSAETLAEPPRPDIKLQPLPFHGMMEAQAGAGVSK